MPVTVIATFDARDGRRDDVLKAVMDVADQVRSEPGCLTWAPHTAGKNSILIVESWANRDALTTHSQASVLAELMEATRPFLATPPQVVVAHPCD